MSNPNTSSAKLRSIASAESAALSAFLPLQDRRLALLEICRAIDMACISFQSANNEVREFSRWGMNKALMLCLNGFGKHGHAILSPSTREMFEWSHAFLQQCGRIALCEQYLDYEAAGLGIFKQDGRDLRFELTTPFVGAEMRDVDEFNWLNRQSDAVYKPLRSELDRLDPAINEAMRSLVRVWETHYIGYNTSPEIDEFYKWRGILLANGMPGHDAFADGDKFGGLEFAIYRAAAWTLVGWGLKHENFAFLLSERHPFLFPPNLITITSDIELVNEELAAALGITEPEARQALMTLEACPTDPEEMWTNGHYPPPLLRVSEKQYIRLLCGEIGNPFAFMLYQLRRFYRSDWDSAVNGRERRFCDELYKLLNKPSLRALHPNVNLKLHGKLITDIDAAVWDTKTGTLGLFQLKWQDLFGNSMRKRFSRMKNMQTEATRWIEGVEQYLQTATWNEIKEAFRLPKDCSPPSQYLLFVVGRNAVHFSGEQRPDPRTAWAVWPQLVRIVSELNSREWILSDLHKALTDERDYYANIKIEIFSFNVQDLTIHLPGVTG